MVLPIFNILFILCLISLLVCLPYFTRNNYIFTFLNIQYDQYEIEFPRNFIPIIIAFVFVITFIIALIFVAFRRIFCTRNVSVCRFLNATFHISRIRPFYIPMVTLPIIIPFMRPSIRIKLYTFPLRSQKPIIWPCLTRPTVWTYTTCMKCLRILQSIFSCIDT